MRSILVNQDASIIRALMAQALKMARADLTTGSGQIVLKSKVAT